jgi:uncharacterized protein YqeY
MPLIDQVTKDMGEAMKAQDQARLAPLRMLKAAIMNREVEKGRGLEPTEDLQVVQQQVKQRRDSIEMFEQGGRHELAAKERAEIAVLEAYLPAAVPDEEIAAAIASAIAETGAASPKDMGKVMKLVTATFAGRGVDGKALSERVRAALS